MVERSPRFAYELEAQAIAVAEAQAKGALVISKIYLSYIHATYEEGLQWYHFKSMGPTLYSGHTNQSIIQKMKEDPMVYPCIEIETMEKRPDIAFRRPASPIAAIITKIGLLYESPGFDISRFLLQNYRIWTSYKGFEKVFWDIVRKDSLSKLGKS